MNRTTTRLAVISARLRLPRSTPDPAGVSLGRLVMLANAPPSLDTCTSPAASVGETFTFVVSLAHRNTPSMVAAVPYLREKPNMGHPPQRSSEVAYNAQVDWRDLVFLL